MKEHVSLSEPKELLDLMIDQVLVYPDHIEVALNEGSRASVAVQEAISKAKGRSTLGTKSSSVGPQHPYPG